MSLVHALPPGPLDVIGDVHGERQALLQLVKHLGYDDNGLHPQGRTMVFVGDFCDRGPDSPGVLTLVRRWVEAGNAFAVLGNHEINLLRHDAKDGSGWFFDERIEADNLKYAPYTRADASFQSEILPFLRQLPLALERDDIRIVHAAWIDEKIAEARALPAGNIAAAYDLLEDAAAVHAQLRNIPALQAAENAAWPYSLEDGTHKPPFMPAHADSELNKSQYNPLKVLTCGVERRGTDPFYAGGKWRFVERVAWWDSYADTTPVLMGHYWRRIKPINRAAMGKDDQDLFAHIAPTAWHGQLGNVFCMDFSVGARWTARLAGKSPEDDFKLAAMRWPERELVLDDGSRHATTQFMTSAEAAAA
ncbi:MAG: metallophosphoesterase [Comamonas sp.]